MAIDRQNVGPTLRNGSLDDLKLDDLQVVASEGTPPANRRRPPVDVKPKAGHSLPGVEVTEFEATLPIEIYGELFKDHR